MKLLNRQEFLKLPSGTLYAKYGDGFFGKIQVKFDTTSSDFYAMPLIQINTDDHIDACQSFENTKQCRLDFENIMRDGYFEEHQLFAVFEAIEITSLIEIMQTALKSVENNGTP